MTLCFFLIYHLMGSNPTFDSLLAHEGSAVLLFPVPPFRSNAAMAFSGVYLWFYSAFLQMHAAVKLFMAMAGNSNA